VKKKSPPYAIIGAVILGLVAVYVYHQIQLKQAADQQAAIAAAQAAANAAIAAAQKATPQASVNIQPTDMRGVLYATQPVEAGVRISPAFYEVKLTPNEILPDAFTDKSDVVGWFATRKIEKGDPLTPRNIGKSLPYLSQRISPGMRAITLPIFMGGDVNNTGGFVVDGDRVDLLYTPLVGKTELNTQTVLQNLTVLYVPGPQIKTEEMDGITPVPSAGVISVTFEVTPEEAQALVYLSNGNLNGHFNMILRGRDDNTAPKIKPFDLDNYDWPNLSKLQKTIDKSDDRVKQLAAQIEATEKSQGTTNETNPTPPIP